MSCHCFNQILSEEVPTLSAVSYIKFENDNCSKITWELKKHQVLSSIFNLNYSYSTTEIKIKTEYNCFDKKFDLQILSKILNKHRITLEILENEVNKSKQHDLKINVNPNFQHLLGKTVEIEKYIKCLKEYISIKSLPLKIFGGNVHTFSIIELEVENQNHQLSLQLLQLFFSFKNFYSVEFDC